MTRVADWETENVCARFENHLTCIAPEGSGVKIWIMTREIDAMSGVTDKQLDELQIGKLTPLHPQDALIKAGAVYECKHGVLEDITANDVVVDGRIVTGQNQMASCMVPQLLMKFLTTAKTTSEK